MPFVNTVLALIPYFNWGIEGDWSQSNFPLAYAIFLYKLSDSFFNTVSSVIFMVDLM